MIRGTPLMCPRNYKVCDEVTVSSAIGQGFLFCGFCQFVFLRPRAESTLLLTTNTITPPVGIPRHSGPHLWLQLNHNSRAYQLFPRHCFQIISNGNCILLSVTLKERLLERGTERLGRRWSPAARVNTIVKERWQMTDRCLQYSSRWELTRCMKPFYRNHDPKAWGQSPWDGGREETSPF